MRKFLLLGAALAPLLWLACAPVHRYKGSRVNWTAPVFLDSGRIGVAQVSWDEYEINCSSYPGAGLCIHAENVHLEFVAFSPASGVLDTLLPTRKLAGWGGSGEWARLSWYPPYAYFQLVSIPGILADLRNGETRPTGSRSAFSRSGRHLVHYSDALDLESGQERQWISWSRGIGYYDDIEEKLLLNYNVLYVPATGRIDSTRPHLPPLSTYRGGTYVGHVYTKPSDGSRLLFSPIGAFDLENPRMDSVLVPGSHVTDFDPPARLYLRNVVLREKGSRSGPDEIGIALCGFDGGESIYRASDYHPRLGRRGGTAAPGL